MMKIVRWDIFFVNFNPSRWSEQAWYRPALIIQNNVWNQFSDTIIICAISSNKKDNPTNVLIKPDKFNWLKNISTIKTSQILTIDKIRLIKKIWTLNSDDMEMVDYSLRISLNL